MEALAIIARAEAAGFRIESRGGELVVRGPRRGHESILERLRDAKAELIAALQLRDPATAPESLAADADSWFLIDGHWYAPDAAELYQNSKPFSVAPARPCHCCGGTRRWRLRRGGPWVCARCHPADRADAAVEWIALVPGMG